MATQFQTRTTTQSMPAIAKPTGRHDTPLGTADWLEFDQNSKPTHHRGDLWLSRLPTGEPVGFRDDRHVLVVSGARGGKGATFLIPNLCLWQGSTVVIDPKGENAMVTARRRGGGSPYCAGMGQKVYLLDPFDTVKTPSDSFSDLRVRFNPLDMIRQTDEESVDKGGRIAESIIVSESSAEPYWDDSARGALKYVCLEVATGRDYLPHERNLVTVRKLLMAGKAELSKMLAATGKKGTPSGFALLFDAMKRNPAFGGVVANAGELLGNMEATSPRTLFNIMQVACTNTDFIDSPAMQRCLSGSDFALSELKTDRKGVNLFISLPQRYMETHYRWLRMMTTLTLGEMERVAAQPASGHPVLMVLDEFPALRRMRVVENAAAQIAGFGVKMVFVAQTLVQLKEHYKDQWETFVANAGVKLFFCNDDHFTREYASKLIGEREVVRTAYSTSSTSGLSFGTSHGQTDGWSSNTSYSQTHGTSANGANIGTNSSVVSGRTSSQSTSTNVAHTSGHSSSETRGTTQSIHKRPLVTPDEVGRIFGDRSKPAALAIISGHQPLYLARTAYFADEAFMGLFDPHRDHVAPITLEKLEERQERRRQEAIKEQLAREAARAAAEYARNAEKETKLLHHNERLRTIEHERERKKQRRQAFAKGLRYAGIALLGLILITVALSLAGF